MVSFETSINATGLHYICDTGRKKCKPSGARKTWQRSGGNQSFV